ncbi:MAG: hypothetical protein PHV12_02115 [Bacteroidales bacterium]|jgi:hypothetical protein|nr:hypothetical protein [Bacteroidales bacterium]MDD3272522.1 hypothetical protein [Bacteroidales bacterium]
MFKKDNNAGLYMTIAVHLVLLIVLLSSRIGFIIQEESSFVLDFTKEEEIEKIKREERLREEISKELDDMLSGRTPVRNVVVDATNRGNNLRDDRFKNPNEVYNEAQELQKKLDAARREAARLQGSDEDIAPAESEKKEEKRETYKGPSVVSYTLEGRKSISMPIPVYKCVAGGDVSVAIIVNRNGYVIDASVIDNASAKDLCIREYAVRAAAASRFTRSSSSPERQRGEIVYRFIAQ